MGTQALTQHSFRSMGPQFHARRGVPLSFVEVLARWLSTTIKRFVADALAERASRHLWQPRKNGDASDILGAMGCHGEAGISVHALSRWIKQCVRAEL